MNNSINFLEFIASQGIVFYLTVYLIIMNIVGFASMGIDKSKARRHAFRTPEKVLFMIAIFGGSLGSTIGMHIFHHKTKHWYFLYGMPAILVIHILIIAYLIGSPTLMYY